MSRRSANAAEGRTERNNERNDGGERLGVCLRGLVWRAEQGLRGRVLVGRMECADARFRPFDNLRGLPTRNASRPGRPPLSLRSTERHASHTAPPIKPIPKWRGMSCLPVANAKSTRRRGRFIRKRSRLSFPMHNPPNERVSSVI